MAETAGAINATLVKLWNATIPVANLVANEVTVDSTIIDVSNKDSAGWAENITGRLSWSMSCESVMEFDTSVGTGSESWQDILGDQIAGTAWSIVFGTGVAADPKLSGSARITSITWSNPDNDKSTYSVEFTGTGAITLGVFP